MRAVTRARVGAGMRYAGMAVYSRASVLGFTREELDDILQTIQPEDMQGTSSADEAADRLLSSVYMAVVSDVGETEGLTPPQVPHGAGSGGNKCGRAKGESRENARVLCSGVAGM